MDIKTELELLRKELQMENENARMRQAAERGEIKKHLDETVEKLDVRLDNTIELLTKLNDSFKQMERIEKKRIEKDRIERRKRKCLN